MIEPQDLKYWLALHNVEGIGAATYQKLLDKFASPKEVVAAKKEAIASIPRLSKAKAEEILAVNERMDEIENLMLRLDDLGVAIVTVADESYPVLLRQVKNPPPIVYIYGQIKKQDENGMAIVGSRNATKKVYRLPIASADDWRNEVSLSSAVTPKGLIRKVIWGR